MPVQELPVEFLQIRAPCGVSRQLLHGARHGDVAQMPLHAPLTQISPLSQVPHEAMPHVPGASTPHAALSQSGMQQAPP